MSVRRTLERMVLCGIVGASLLAGVAKPARADRDDRGKCEQNVRKAEERLHEAERKHGEHSKQARQRRQQLEEVRERCRKAGWGDRDHDRDHDHDRR